MRLVSLTHESLGTPVCSAPLKPKGFFEASGHVRTPVSLSYLLGRNFGPFRTGPGK